MYDIANKLKQLRIKNKVSQDELADGILVSRQTISKWENGVVLPSLDNLQALCAFFKVEINYFFDEKYDVRNGAEEEGATTISAQEEGKSSIRRSRSTEKYFRIILSCFGSVDFALQAILVGFLCIYFPTFGRKDVAPIVYISLPLTVTIIILFCIFCAFTAFSALKYIKYRRAVYGKRIIVAARRSQIADCLYPVALVFLALCDIVLEVIVIAFSCLCIFETTHFEFIVVISIALAAFLIFTGLTVFTIFKFVKYRRSISISE